MRVNHTCGITQASYHRLSFGIHLEQTTAEINPSTTDVTAKEGGASELIHVSPNFFKKI